MLFDLLLCYFYLLQGRCIDGPNKYSCICDPGYVGSSCDTDYDDCSPSPCIHGQWGVMHITTKHITTKRTIETDRISSIAVYNIPQFKRIDVKRQTFLRVSVFFLRRAELKDVTKDD